MQTVIVYNPNAHLVLIGRKGPNGSIVDQMKIVPGNNTVDADALDRVRKGSKKCNKWFSPAYKTKRLKVVGKPVEILAETTPSLNTPPAVILPDSLIGFEDEEALDFIGKADDTTTLVKWGQELEEKPELRDTILERLKELGANIE